MKLTKFLKLTKFSLLSRRKATKCNSVAFTSPNTGNYFIVFTWKSMGFCLSRFSSRGTCVVWWYCSAGSRTEDPAGTERRHFHSVKTPFCSVACYRCYTLLHPATQLNINGLSTDTFLSLTRTCHHFWRYCTVFPVSAGSPKGTCVGCTERPNHLVLAMSSRALCEGRNEAISADVQWSLQSGLSVKRLHVISVVTDGQRG